MKKPTVCGHFFDVHSVFLCHVAKHREDGESWEEAGDTVHRAGQEGIPVRKEEQH